MTTAAWKHACISVLFAAAVAGEEAKGPPELVVPRRPAPVLDGKLDDATWKDPAGFALTRGTVTIGSVSLAQEGRNLHVGAELRLDPSVTGFRINVRDAVTRGRHVFIVFPANAPKSPIEGWRFFSRQKHRQLSCATARVRFAYDKRGFTFELSMPCDLLEFARGDTAYEVGFEVWNVPAGRPIAIYPGEDSAQPGVGFVLLRPAKDWGDEVPLDVVPEADPALALLETIAAEAAGKPIGSTQPEPTLTSHTGWRNGRRREAPLASLEKKLLELAAAYPDNVSLPINLTKVRMARGDYGGALEATEMVVRAMPALADLPRRILVRMELLRSAERFGDAMAEIEKRPLLLKESLAARESLAALERMRRDFALELAMRAEDEARNDLPRARIKTGRGDIVIELFEDDAPNAVANFVALAEQGAYDGTRFHWSEGGRSVVGGDPNSRDEDPSNDGYGDPGYLIETEVSRRLHFAYTVSFADKRDQPRSVGSTFMIHLAPATQFDGMATVFARIIEGKDVARKLEYADEIESVRITRKRPHKYEPVKRPSR